MMQTISVLVIHADGTQESVERQVPDDYFDPTPDPAPLTADEIPIE
jgi:hypothetical protein